MPDARRIDGETEAIEAGREQVQGRRAAGGRPAGRQSLTAQVAAAARIGACALVAAVAVIGGARAEPLEVPRAIEELPAFEKLAEEQARRGARPRSVDRLRWMFDLYSGYHYTLTPEWSWNPLFDKVPADRERADKLRVQIYEACRGADTLGCGGEFVFGYENRSGMFHIKLLPDQHEREKDPRFTLDFPQGRATFRVIDLKPFGTRMPNYTEMDEAPSLRRAGFRCRVQGDGRRDAIPANLAVTVRRLRAEYLRTRKALPDYDVQCTTNARGFFPVYSKAGEDLQLLSGHISPRGTRLQFENPILLITPSALFFSARLDKSRVNIDDTTPE